MPHQDQKQMRVPEEDKKIRHEEQFVPEQRSFGMPNSLMSAVSMTPPPGMPNSVMREMDPEDSGVLFRGRGFDPSVGAHELSHTVRHETVPVPVSMSVPDGTIQREDPPRGSGFGHAGAAAAAAAEPEPEEEDESAEQQIDTMISSGLGRIAALRRAFGNDKRKALNKLTEVMVKEENPTSFERMINFRQNLDVAEDRLTVIARRLNRARNQLDHNGDLQTIWDNMQEPLAWLEELTTVQKAMAMFLVKPKIFDDLIEMDEMEKDFVEVGKNNTDSPAAKVPSAPKEPVVYNVPLNAPQVTSQDSGLPPSYHAATGTPGGDPEAMHGAPEPSGGLPSYLSVMAMSTPGGDPAAPAAQKASQEPAEPAKPKRRRRFFHRD